MAQKNTPDLSRGRVVAIAGATGAVGEVLLQILEQRNFPVSELRPLASERSAGTATITFRGKKLPVQLARPEAFDGVDFVFFAATGALARELAPEVAKRGGIAIDKSNTWRMDPQVPLVIPEINGAALEKHQGIIASPNCTTTPFAMALAPLRKLAKLKRIVVTTFQSASGAGLPGIEELDGQLKAIATGQPVPKPKQFKAQIANNVVPVCETFRPNDSYTTEEVKLLHETRKILEDPSLDVAMTCVRVPVPVGHSASVLLETEPAITPEQARAAIAAFPGIRVMDDPAHDVFPTPLDCAGGDDILVGRIRRDLNSDRLWLWTVGDNLRKGAALNAVQIAEELMKRGLR
ncbi:MAG TPA: aspartate-semialdehyde dehydrogenase [Myxococcota bacterium]|nr:aspartate-semialdehyde dehydrogenase [Myxococcota bacterium]